MSNIAIIPARGGSKRIPQKNIKEFCGKPIIAYSIETALECGIFDEVMVSTDSEEIAKVAIKYGANIPFMRKGETSGDYASTADVLLEVLGMYNEMDGRNFDCICCIYPTAPFITVEKLKLAYKEFINHNAESLISVVKYSYPPQRSFVIRNNRVQFVRPEYEYVRSQDLEEIYHDSGQFYFLKTSTLFNLGSLITTNTIPYILKEEETQDIDNLSDWRIAEMKYINIQNSK